MDQPQAAAKPKHVSDLHQRDQALSGFILGRLMMDGVIVFDNPTEESHQWQNAMLAIGECLALLPYGDWPNWHNLR
jgi:hypothetical protein